MLGIQRLANAGVIDLGLYWFLFSVISQTKYGPMEQSTGAHHVDLRYSTSEDPEWLQKVRKKEIKIISRWISQYHHGLA